MPQISIPPSPQRAVAHIRSRHNARLKDLRQRLQHPTREVDDRIAVEGIHLAQEVLRSGLQIETLFLREDSVELLAGFPANEALIVEQLAFNAACATEAPQGIAALVQKPVASLDQVLLDANSLLIILDGIQDPGNLGTILRSAEAFGCSGMLLLPGTVSPWNQKAMRASAGSVFRIPLVNAAGTGTLSRLKQNGIAIHAAVARDGEDVARTSLDGPIALLIGNEGAGISDNLLQMADGRIHISCVGPVESLNAGVAASILLYAAAQQRSAAAKSAKKPGVRA